MRNWQNYLQERKSIVEKLVNVVILVYPLTALPQIIKIWVYKNAQGVSALTWLLFLIMIIPLILYSMIQKEKKLTFMWGTWSIIYLVVIVGTLLYD